MMIEISIIRDIIACFGVLAGFSYYVLSVRNQYKTRQAQLFNSVGKDLSDYNSWLVSRELILHGMG
jgi:hypothetical protein